MSIQMTSLTFPLHHLCSVTPSVFQSRTFILAVWYRIYWSSIVHTLHFWQPYVLYCCIVAPYLLTSEWTKRGSRTLFSALSVRGLSDFLRKTEKLLIRHWCSLIPECVCIMVYVMVWYGVYGSYGILCIMYYVLWDLL